MKVTFIGGGNMAKALLAGLQKQQFDMSHIQVIELDINKHENLRQSYGVSVSTTLESVTNHDVIVLAIKPQQMHALALQLAPLLSHQLIVSIAAGINLNTLSKWLGGYEIIVRAMPNTPAQIQAGITGLFALAKVSPAQKKMADQILSAAGCTLWLETEAKLDAVTAISGSGPAYVFYFIEALEAAALALGLNASEAKQLSLETFSGAALLAANSPTPVETLRQQVTSKGGTTEQGLLSLENAHVKAAIIDAAQKAHDRALSLGTELTQISPSSH